MTKTIIGIVGSYRKGHIIDSAVDAVLDGARAGGAKTEKIYLLDKDIKFCTNCRSCTQDTQTHPRAKCIHHDDMEAILSQIDGADGLVFGAPVNCGSVTAITQRFVERLLVYTQWRWGTIMPHPRINKPTKPAVIIFSASWPGFLGPLFLRTPATILKRAARYMGYKHKAVLYYGQAGLQQNLKLTEKQISQAYNAGRNIVN